MLTRNLKIILICLVTALIFSSQVNQELFAATGDDYYVYSTFNAPGTGLVWGVGGYVQYYGVPEWGDEIQYVYFLQREGSRTIAYKVKVSVTNEGSAADPTPHIDISQHPDHPDYTGPIEPRHFEIVSSHDITEYADNGDWASDEFYVDSTGVYLGAWPYGINKWDHDWNYIGQIAPVSPPSYMTQTLAYDPARNVWYAGGAWRDILQLSDINSDGDFMDETWQYIFTTPDYAGSHHDGMEYVGGYLWISDMTSDVIAKWQYDDSTDTWAEIGRYSYTEAASVEGMGFGPNDHFWIGGYDSAYIYELGNEITKGYPIANAGPDVEAHPPTIPITVDGSGSHHTDPAKQIVLYEWDFEGDGIWDYTGTNPIVEHTYPAYYNADGSINWDSTAKDYPATLRVTDNSDPALQDTDTCIVHITAPPWKPVSDPGGPYGGVTGVPIQLDGSESYDPESKMVAPGHPWYETIAKYEWDLDYDGEFDDSMEVKPSWTWASEGIYIVGLRVTDSQPSGPGGTVGPLDVDVKHATVVITKQPPPTTKIETHVIDSANGTAKFTWSGSDDSTPPAQLVYKHRLLDPDSPIYDWWPKDEEWSSSTTATYPRSGNPRLPDGTYRFQVKAKDADEAVQPSPTTYEFTMGGATERVPVIIIPGVMGSYLGEGDILPWSEIPLVLWDPNLHWATGGILVFSEVLAWLTGLPESARTLLSDPDNDLVAWQVDDLYYDVIGSLILSGNYVGPSVLLYPYARFEEEEFTNPPLGLDPRSDDNLFVFPYDWRKDIREIARNLSEAIGWVKRTTGSDQVDVVAHSMGGLVARYYVNKLGGNDTVRKLVFMGVPSFGSPAMYVALKTGALETTGTSFWDQFWTTVIDVSWFIDNFLSSFELLPTDDWWDPICAEIDTGDNHVYLFNDQFKTLGGLWNAKEGELKTRTETYESNQDSRLTSRFVDEAHEFHEEMGSTLRFDGEFYNFVGVGVITPYQLEKAMEWGPGIHKWNVHFGNGDGRVPQYSADSIDLTVTAPMRCIVYKSAATHGGSLMTRDDVLSDVVTVLTSRFPEALAAVRGHTEPDRTFSALSYGYVTFNCPIAIQVVDAAGEIIAAYDSDAGVSYGGKGTSYYRIGESHILVLPTDMTASLRIEGTGSGVLSLEVCQVEGGIAVRRYVLANVPISPSTRAVLDYSPATVASPVLKLDNDGDGIFDDHLAVLEGNTPLGGTMTLSFCDGMLALILESVVAAGHTVCGSVDSLEGIGPSFHPVTPFYWLSTSALFSGSASITIQYDEDDVPTGRESDLKLYRITSEDAIEDITQKLDQAANTVTGQTDGFSYFVVGYMSASPETSILSPSAGDTVTGQSCRIDWQATDPDNSTSSLSIDLFYSTDGGTTWTSISSNETNDGAYDWDISALHGAEYWLKIVAEDPEEGTSEATVGPFTISVFEGNIIVGPNPVTNTGTTFFYTLSAGTATTKLMILSPSGRLMFETVLDADSTRFPSAGTWNPVNQDGISLANGPYVYVLIADGKVIGQGKMVIQR
jgi:pimeloyl-ACP methyl ester carboxylesterase